MNTIATLLAFTVAFSVRFSTGEECDFAKYPRNGCEDDFQECNTIDNRCDCKYGSAIKVNGKCLKLSGINDKCFATKQCLTRDAKCLTRDNHELKENEHYFINVTNTVQKPSGVCQCLSDHFFNRGSKNCETRVLGSKCSEDYHCQKTFTYCNVQEGKCRCEDGYLMDEEQDICHGIRIITNVETFGTVCHSWDPVSRRCRIVSSWDSARSWSSFVWKLAVLCVILVLLMLLIGGIQRARHNDNLTSWGRAIEAYNARNRSVNALRANRRNQSPTELGCMMTTDAHVITVQDDPPPYEEAVAMSNTVPRTPNPPSYHQ